MARIPQYNRSVAPQDTPYGYLKSNASPEAFGSNIASAWGNLGDAGLNAMDALATLKANYDKTKLLEFSNNIDNWSNENLYDKDKGYLNKTGKEAMGKSPDVMDSFDKFIDDYISKSGFIAGWEQQARRIADAKRRTVERYVEAHDKKETDAWQDMVYTDALTNIFQKAIRGRNNPQDLDMFYKDGLTLLDNYAITKGWDKDPEMLSIKKKEFEGGFHAQILGAYLAEGSLKAGEYFEQHKDKFSPEVQNKYLQVIHREQVSYQSRETAQFLIGLPTEEAYKVIDNIENIDVRNATENEYNRLLRHQDEVQKQTDAKVSNEIMQKVYYAYENGEDVSAIMREVNASNMSLEQKEKMYKNLKAMQELQGVGDNWADYNILLDMAAFDNDGFKTINPANYNLTKEQYNKIVEMQRKAANNEYTPEAELKKAIKGMFNPNFNIQGKNGLHKSEYEDEVVRFLSAVERMQGKAFDLKNTAQLQSVMKAFDYKDPNATNKNIDETKELFMRAKKDGEAYKLMAKEYMQFKGVNKREPLPQEIYEMAKRTYNTIENEWKNRDKGKLNSSQGIYKSVNETKAKKGETKVLTYYADVRIPQISRELGIPLQVTSRYRAGDNGGHGKGRKCDVGMASLNISQRLRVFERMLSDPAVASIGTSDPILLKRFNNPPNPKIRDLREYDINYRKSHPNTTMNHVNHIDISFDTRYGGDKQG